MARELICPKCGAHYEQNPLDPVVQALCPACCNEIPWSEIQHELAVAAEAKAKEFARHSAASEVKSAKHGGATV